MDKKHRKVMKLDRKVSVVPMMDWTDEVKKCSWFKHLAGPEKRRSLYGAATRK